MSPNGQGRNVAASLKAAVKEAEDATRMLSDAFERITDVTALAKGVTAFLACAYKAAEFAKTDK